MRTASVPLSRLCREQVPKHPIDFIGAEDSREADKRAFDNCNPIDNRFALPQKHYQFLLYPSYNVFRLSKVESLNRRLS
jgi:hypothetical protein